MVPSTMEDCKQDRKRKGDKAKEKYERNGGYSQKHIRLVEALEEKRASAGQPAAKGQLGSKN